MFSFPNITDFNDGDDAPSISRTTRGKQVKRKLAGKLTKLAMQQTSVLKCWPWDKNQWPLCFIVLLQSLYTPFKKSNATRL